MPSSLALFALYFSSASFSHLPRIHRYLSGLDTSIASYSSFSVDSSNTSWNRCIVPSNLRFAIAPTVFVAGIRVDPAETGKDDEFFGARKMPKILFLLASGMATLVVVKFPEQLGALLVALAAGMIILLVDHRRQ